jgi:DNA (cytosine-5)-methyltransferase 1
MRYVVNAERPFIVGVGGPSYSGKPVTVDQPLGAQTTENHRALVQPFVAGIDNKSNGDRDVWQADEPPRTVTVENRFALVAPLTHQGGERGQGIDQPFPTITAAHRGELALIAPHVTKFRAGSDGHPITDPLHTVTANSFKKRPGGAVPLGLVSAVLTPRYGERAGQAPRTMPVDKPMPTVVPTQNGAQLVSAFLAQHNGGMVGHDAREPVSTIVGKVGPQALVAAAISHQRTSNTAGGRGDPRAPAKTITAGGTHQALLACELSDEDRAGAERVAAFLVKYYSAAQHGQSLKDPLHSTTSKPRFGLVTVMGLPIVDIGMRMLTPRELFRAQGFPETYTIDHGPDGKPLTKTAQTRMCGNSVCPPVAEALVRANLVDVAADVRAAD